MVPLFLHKGKKGTHMEEANRLVAQYASESAFARCVLVYLCIVVSSAWLSPYVPVALSVGLHLGHAFLLFCLGRAVSINLYHEQAFTRATERPPGPQ